MYAGGSSLCSCDTVLFYFVFTAVPFFSLFGLFVSLLLLMCQTGTFTFVLFWVFLCFFYSWVTSFLFPAEYVPPVSICFDLGDSLGLGARQSLGGGAAGVAARGGGAASASR